MKRSKVWMLASILALGGMSVSTIGTPLLTVQAAEEATVAAKEYHTQGGIDVYKRQRLRNGNRVKQSIG